jgi:hypothetical protein
MKKCQWAHLVNSSSRKNGEMIRVPIVSIKNSNMPRYIIPKIKLICAKSLLQEQLNKDDPTEVFQLCRLVGLGNTDIYQIPTAFRKFWKCIYVPRKGKLFSKTAAYQRQPAASSPSSF